MDMVERVALAAWAKLSGIPMAREDWMDDEWWQEVHTEALARWPEQTGFYVDANGFRECARAAIAAMRDVENDTLAAGHEAMFVDKWDGTQAPMMGAGWNAMIDAALK